MTVHFQLVIGYDENSEEWGVIIESQGQTNSLKHRYLKDALKEMVKRIVRREKRLKDRPISLVLMPNGARNGS